MSSTRSTPIYFYIQRYISTVIRLLPSWLLLIGTFICFRLTFMFHLYAVIRVTCRGDDEPFYAFQPYLAPQTGKSSEGCHIRFVGTPHPPYSPPAQWVAIYSAAKSKAARQSPTIAVLRPEDEVNSDTYRIRRDVRCERQIKRMIDDICVQCNFMHGPYYFYKNNLTGYIKELTPLFPCRPGTVLAQVFEGGLYFSL